MNDMRAIIDKTEPLFEMPFLTTTEEDFFLADRDYNKRQADRLIASSYRTIRDTDYALLADCNAGAEGEIFLYEKETGLISYFVRYERKQVAPFGNCVTQVALWRSADASIEHVTTTIFDSYLLANYDAVISDEMQTRDGQRFWISRMTTAFRKGLTVGLYVGGTLHLYDRSQPLGDWIGAMDAWGDEDEHLTKLFVIANK